MRVLKYPCPIGSEDFSVPLPKGAVVLSVQMQHGIDQKADAQIWALVNEEDADVESRRFIMRGTGWPVPPISRYVGTIQDGGYVWHLFEAA